MSTHGDPITVAAICETGKRMKPVWFVHQGRQHRVTEVTYCWREQVGATTYHHYTVFDGQES